MPADKPIQYEEALEKAGHGKLQWLVTFSGAMCLLCSYVAVSSVSFVLPSSQCDLQLTSQGKGSLISSGFIGIILSSHLWGFLSDTLGRRYILTRCLLADGILYVCTSFVPNYWLFLLMRLFNGFSSCGGVVSAWAYIGEFHTDVHRTRAIMIASTVGTSIYIWLPCLAWLVLPLKFEIPLYDGFVYKSWRLFYLLCGVPSLLTSLLMMSLPESPKFLLARGENRECIKVLQYVYSLNTDKPPHDLVLSNVVIGDNEKIVKAEGDPHSIRVFFQKMWIQTVPLLKKPLNFTFFILCIMQFILYNCNNGMFLWVPEIVNRIAQYKENNPNQAGTFCQAVQNYQTVLSNTASFIQSHSLNKTDVKILKYMKDMEDNATVCDDSIDFSVYYNTVTLGIFSVLGLVLIVILMKIFSRKSVLATFMIGSVITVILLVFLNKIDLIFSMVTIFTTLSGSAIPVVTSIAVDHFPTNLRAMTVCLILLTGRLGTIVSSLIVGTTLDTQCDFILYSFAALIALCALLVVFLPKVAVISEKKEIQVNGSTEINKTNMV